MKKQFLLFTLLALAIFFSCNQSSNQSAIPASTEPSVSEGFQLLKTNCFSCHSPNPDLENRVAPTMAEIKLAYLDKEGGSKDEFTKNLIAFLRDPSEANVKMKEALKKYGSMPVMNYSDVQIQSVAAYLYQSKIETPEWYDKIFPLEREKYAQNKTTSDPLELGKSIAMQTKGVLGKNLLNALKTKGSTHAVSFCSSRAYHLTDSMGIALDSKVKRVSDKNRNPENEANETELAYINASKALLAKGEEIQPKLVKMDGQTFCYYPIMTNKMCMQCHGDPETDILPETYTKIKELYPEDKAIGYIENELRGIWVVEME